MNKKKIGIMGGTFNPIHNGHVTLAERAYEQFHLDSILFMPTKNPPHKKHKIIVSEQHRSNMVKLAIEEISYFQFSSLELDRQGITYTVDTLSYLTSSYKDAEYYFIIGADSLFQIETWYRSEQIMKLTHLLAATRYHLSDDNIEEQIDYLNKKYGAQVHQLKVDNMDVSSDQIRQAVQNGISVSGLVNSKVENYIKENHLYK